jgi:hypothetical protein
MEKSLMDDNALLTHVVRGEEDLACKLIIDAPEQLLTKMDVTDYAGRCFHNINSFEYALWALDSHMWSMMLKTVSTIPNYLELLSGLREQHERFKINGITYTLDGKEIKEHHFNFEQLILALDTYHKQFHQWSESERDKYWCTVIGKAQYELPAHVAQEYCFPGRSFEPRPAFHETQLPRCLMFYNNLQHRTEEWWPKEESTTRLGVDFAIVGPRQWIDRSKPIMPRGLVAHAEKPALIDMKAIHALHLARSQDFQNLAHLLRG